MSFEPLRLPPVSGNIRRVSRRRGALWYVKYRMPDPTRPGRVRQVEKMLGPEWPDTGPPPPGYYDRRSAQAALEAILTDARRGAIELARTGVTFEQAAIEWLRWGEYERGWKRSTLVDRRSALTHHLLPEFGALAVNQITTRRVEAWKIRWLAEHDARRQGAKLLAILHGIMERARKAYDLPRNPVADVDRIRVSYDAARFDFYSPEEVYALARAAASEQDAAMFLTAAFGGLRRGEVVALRWRDVDFEKRSIRVEGSFSHGAVTRTKGGRARAVPLVAEVAQVLARLGQRGYATGREDPVFPRRGRRPPRRVSVAAAVHHRAGRGRPTLAALPRFAPHVRVTRDQPCEHRSGSGLDGPRRREDDDALFASQEPGERGRTARRRVSPDSVTGPGHRRRATRSGVRPA
jgi:integrase